MASKITENGGEGVIIRKLHSCYENGRSIHLLKIKVSLFLYSSILYYNNQKVSSVDDKEGMIISKNKTFVTLQMYVNHFLHILFTAILTSNNN
jgi:hypothetical protein